MNKNLIKSPSNRCQVCNNVAIGYHYGAFVCEACKKFFVRHSSGKLYGNCQHKRNCDLAINGRGKCQYCRMQRCHDVGMSIKYKISDYTLCSVPCQVCGAKSSGLHFGCITCEGCKGFFRRMSNCHGMLVCFNNSKCDLKSNTRSSCKSCRFDRCIDVGMSRTGIRIGRHPNALKYDCLNNMKTENTPPTDLSVPKSPLGTPVNGTSVLSENTDRVSEEKRNDEVACDQDTTCQRNSSIDIDEELRAEDETILINNHCVSSMLDTDLFLELEEHITQIINNVSPSLVVLTRKEMVLNKEINIFTGSETAEIVWSSMMDHFVFHSKVIVKFAKLVPGFSKLSLSDKKVVIKCAIYPMMLLKLSLDYCDRNGEIFFNYFDFSSSDREIILGFFPEFIEFSNHLKKCGSIKYLFELNAVEITLLSGIVMFNNYDSFSDSKFGHSMMNLYQEFLLIYFESKLGYSTPEADDRMKIFLEFIDLLNDMNRCHHTIISDFCATHTELQYPDLYIEMFND